MNRGSTKAIQLGAVLLAMTLGATLAAAPAHAYVPTCTLASHCHGVMEFNARDNLHAVGTDLSVQCLHVPDRSTDFATMEMWLLTRTDRPDRATWNWVEAGMVAGTLWASPGQEQGFIWYWADRYGDLGQYFEHYIGPAFVNSPTNVSFYWESPGWGVYKGGAKVGWSGVGPYPGLVDVGGESTTGLVATHGRATNWQYADKVGTWRWLTSASTTSLRNGDAIFASMPSTATVTVDTPYWACGGPPPTLQNPGTATRGPSADALRAAMSSPESAHAHLATQTRRMVNALGTADLANARYVKTSRTAGLARHGGTEVTDRPAYVIQVTGSFAKRAGNGQRVTGTVLEIIVDAETGQATDWGLTTTTDDLRDLGAVQSLY